MGALGAIFRLVAAFGVWVLLAFILFLVGLVLVLLGFDLGEVDAWLEARGGWLDAVGSIALQVVCGLFLLLCVAMFGIRIFDRKSPDPAGWGCLVLAAIGGYFAWFGMIGD